MNVPLAVVERLGAVRIVHNGDSRVVLDEGRWPSWRPGHDELAASVVTTADGSPRGLLRLASTTGGEARTIAETAPGAPPAIAPGVPNYALWAPEGSRLVVAMPAANGLELQVVDMTGGPARPIATGAPLFSAWAPDSRRVIVHAGAELLMLDTDDGTRTVLHAEAAGFRVPAVSRSGRICFATPAGGTARIMSCLLDDPDPVVAGEFPGGVALAFRPGGDDELSVSVMRDPEGGLFGELWLVPAVPGGAPRRLVRSLFAAASWSPRGDRVALVVPGYTGDGRYAIHIHNAEGAFLAATEPLVPSEEFRMMLAFFDQYALSHPAWSPDGATFAVAGRIATDGVSASFGDARNAVYVWAGERGTALRRIADGDFASFPCP